MEKDEGEVDGEGMGSCQCVARQGEIRGEYEGMTVQDANIAISGSTMTARADDIG